MCLLLHFLMFLYFLDDVHGHNGADSHDFFVSLFTFGSQRSGIERRRNGSIRAARERKNRLGIWRSNFRISIISYIPGHSKSIARLLLDLENRPAFSASTNAA